MANEIDLDKRIEDEKKQTRMLIRDSTKSDVDIRGGKKLERKTGDNLYDIVVNRLSDSTRNTPEQIGYLDSYETALSVFRSCALSLRETIDVLTLEERLSSIKANGDLPKTTAPQQMSTKEKELSDEITDAVLFSNKYALYFAGQVGLALINSSKTNTELRVGFSPEDYSSTDRDLLTTRLATRTGSNLSTVLDERGNEVKDDDFKSTLEGTFTTWINQFNWDRFSKVAEKYGIEKSKIKYKNYSVEAGKFKRTYSDVRVSEFMDVRKEDVIGSEEFQKILWDGLMRLLAYDPEKKQNPLDPPKVIFTTGDPGCGKTFVSHAMIRSAADVAAEIGIPYWAFPFSISDFGSEFKDKAPLRLAEVAKEIVQFPGPVVQYVADADTLFKSRKDPNATQEDQKVMSVFFSMYDGSRIPKNGKFLAIMDANYITDIDDATKSRLFDEIVKLERFKTPEEFGEYARRYLTKGAPAVGVKDSEWTEIGKTLLEGPLSNREIEHVLKGLRRNYEVPIDLLRKSYEEKVSYRNQHFEGITRTKVLDSLQEYVSTRMEIERASQEALATSNVERFLKSIRQVGQDSITQAGSR